MAELKIRMGWVPKMTLTIRLGGRSNRQDRIRDGIRHIQDLGVQDHELKDL